MNQQMSDHERGPADRLGGDPGRNDIDDLGPSENAVTMPRLSITGYVRFFWRQLTSMRTALLLLLLVAIAAIPGSLVPQRLSDPNGVTQYFTNNPDLAPVLDQLQLFDVYSSAWFSAIYILLFISLIGCVIPRTKHHFDAVRARPPRTPARLSRLPSHQLHDYPQCDVPLVLDTARAVLKRAGYRVEPYEQRGIRSLSAERGYLRETGNLVFHTGLLAVIVAVGVGGALGYQGQRVIVEGQSFVNALIEFDSYNPGQLFDPQSVAPYRLTLDRFSVTYETANLDAYGQPTDFTANVTVTAPNAEPEARTIRVNDPMRFADTDVFLMGNGYAPKITIRNANGEIVFEESTPFLPQDSNMTSLGILKVPDGMPEQLGLVGFFYPTASELESGAFTSTFPDLIYPMVSFNVFRGDLGIDGGAPKSVYTLNTDDMTQLTGGSSGLESIQLMPGETADLPDGLGTITFDNIAPQASLDGTESYAGSVARFASFDIASDPGQFWVLIASIIVLGGLIVSLMVPRRRLWVRAVQDGADVRVEYGGLARGEDPRLDAAVEYLALAHRAAIEKFHNREPDHPNHPTPKTRNHS